MDVQLTIKIYYDRERDGSLSEFRTKKYIPFRTHINRLQALGQLPRGDIRWSVEHKKPEPPKPDGPAQVLHLHRSTTASLGVSPYGVPLPMLAHRAGERLGEDHRRWSSPLRTAEGGRQLDPDRIAV